ncbi:thiolase family protein [Isoptericola sp. 178]|uniref:thiolase family protein n=1 Tax=Isoptericola sp. 178 TaxID=3064651 RepID=UPI00271393D7|nr:thiolase family protein [Isoptericola sp. 178]MDO8144446.1 thiolase family protein [Isoptericola sp. 178]
MSVVVAARRTWVGRPAAGHAHADETRLAAAVLSAAAQDASAGRVDDVVLGNAAGHGGNVARRAALAGLGLAVPGISVDRQCASGLAAVATGAALVDAGHADVVLAGGVESTTRAPARSHGRLDYRRASFAPPPWADPEAGQAADRLARARGVTRERQHAYAIASHSRVRAAHEAGWFGPEVTGVGGLDRDEHARPLPGRVLDRLPGAFDPDGSVTAASAAPAADGAAAVALVPDGPPGLRVRGAATVACGPDMPLLAPVRAVRTVCERTGVGPADLAAVELVEAFAVQALVVAEDLGLDPLGDPRWNPDGGALGAGHPFGASGAIAVVRLYSRLVRGGAPAGALGVATAAGTGGVGVALLLEVVR